MRSLKSLAAGGLDEAGERGWIVIGMAEDWGRAFPFTD